MNDVKFLPEHELLIAEYFDRPTPELYLVDEETGDYEVLSARDVLEALTPDDSDSELRHVVARILVSQSPEVNRPDWAAGDRTVRVQTRRRGTWVDPEWRLIILPPQEILSVLWPGVMGSADWYIAVPIPTYETTVIIASVDQAAHGFSHTILGTVDEDDDLIEAAGELIRGWWSGQISRWEQSRWSSVWGEDGLVSKETAFAWRKAIWGE